MNIFTPCLKIEKKRLHLKDIEIYSDIDSKVNTTKKKQTHLEREDITHLKIYNETPEDVLLEIQGQQIPINELNGTTLEGACPISNLHRFKEYYDKIYTLFSQHMYYLYGNEWKNKVDEYSIPFGLVDRVQEEILREKEEDLKAEQENNRILIEDESIKEKIKSEKRTNLTPEEYSVWEKEERLNIRKEIEEWLDQEFYNYSIHIMNEERRKRDGKIWIEEKMKEGKIIQISHGKFDYYP